MGKIRRAIIGVDAFSPARGSASAIACAHAEGIKRNSDGIRAQRILLVMFASAQTHQRITFGENETESEFRFL